jgi:hypothetical protein
MIIFLSLYADLSLLPLLGYFVVQPLGENTVFLMSV